VLAALAVGGLLGFIVMPVVQGRAAGIDAFTAICRAVGILPGSPARLTPPYQAEPQPPKRAASVVIRSKAIRPIRRSRAMSGSRSLLYKQLHDFCSGARVSGTMSPLVKDLDDKEMADLAAYYGRLFRGAIDPEQSGRYVGIDI
jgi:hypothetical protein